MNLKDAYRWLAMQCRLFCQLREDTKPLKDPDFIDVMHMRRGNVIVPQIQSNIHADLEDETITKRYLTSKLQDNELKLLALAFLGTEYLSMMANLEDCEEGKKLLYDAIEKKKIKMARD